MDFMENSIKELIELLPKFQELENVTVKEPEARYIFEITIKFFEECKIKKVNEDKLEKLIYLIQSILEKMWENINIGNFNEVPLMTRKIYSFACYFRILLNLVCKNEFNIEQCNEFFDKSILIGCTEDLYTNHKFFVKKLSEFLRKNQIDDTNITLPYIKPIDNENWPCDIIIMNSPTVTEFQEKCFKSMEPALIKNIINHWPALTKWRDLNYLLKITGNRQVPIEIGSNYASENWSQKLTTMKNFLKRQFEESNTTQDFYEIEYLAQHDLFDQIPELKKDITIPDYCICTEKSNSNFDNGQSFQISNDIDIKVWFGPEGTISPMHQDAKHNILCQVFGRKKIILASPSYTKFLYTHESKMLNNTSQIDAEYLDFEKFPLTKNVKFLQLVLQEGECLYLPPKWWHYVRSLNRSFSVSFWWQ